MNFFAFIEAIERLAQKLEPSYDAENKLPAVASLVNAIVARIPSQ